jgi:hypothetical protein
LSSAINGASRLRAAPIDADCCCLSRWLGMSSV